MATLKTEQPLQSSRWALNLLVLFSALFVFYLYTFLHESGHLLAGLAFGQTPTVFDPNFWSGPHVGFSGELPAAQTAIRIVAGVGFPLLTWFIFISLVPRKASFPLQLIQWLSSITILAGLLPWIALPLFQFFGNPVAADDVTKFLGASQVPPLLLSALAAAIFTLGCVLLLSKAGNPWKQMLRIRQADPGTSLAGTRIAVPLMAGIVLACLAATAAVNGLVVKDPAALRPSPPDGYRPLEPIDLAGQDYRDYTLARFSLEHAGSPGRVFPRREYPGGVFRAAPGW